MLVNRFSITFLALLAPLVMAVARPDQGPGGGSSSGGSGSGEDDDEGGAGDVTEGIPDACLDVCEPISVVKNDCILEFGENLDARACICTTTDPDISVLAPLCADCVLTALGDDVPASGDIKGTLQIILATASSPRLTFMESKLDLVELPPHCGFPGGAD